MLDPNPNFPEFHLFRTNEPVGRATRAFVHAACVQTGIIQNSVTRHACYLRCATGAAVQGMQSQRCDIPLFMKKSFLLALFREATEATVTSTSDPLMRGE